MAKTVTSRFKLQQWSASTDTFIYTELNNALKALEELSAIDKQGLFSARPGASVRGSYYYATDTQTLYRDTGTAWVAINDYTSLRNLPSLLQLGLTATTAAKGDHTHNWSQIEGKVYDAVGTLAGRPASSVLGGTYYATDVKIMYRHTGTAWVALNDYTNLANKPALLQLGATSTTAATGNHSHAWGEITSRPSTFTPAAHTHDWSQVTGRPAFLALGTTASTAAPGNHSHAWGEVTSKPATFPATAHTHLWNEITDPPALLQLGSTSATAAPGNHTHAWSQITSIPATFAPSAHTHLWAHITDKPAFLAIGTTSTTAKAGNYVPAWGEITSKPATFTPSTHTHPWSQVTGQPAFLQLGTTASTAKAGDYVPAWGEITSKPATYPPSAHTHLWAHITDKPAFLALGSTSTTAAPGNHTHSLAQITGQPSDTVGTLSVRPTSNVLGAFFYATDVQIMYRNTGSAWVALNDYSNLANKPNLLQLGSTSATASPGNHSHAWGEITSKPATFAPSAHGHSWGEISGVPSLLQLGTTSSTAAAGNHTHSWSQITSKPTTSTLDGITIRMGTATPANSLGVDGDIYLQY